VSDNKKIYYFGIMDSATPKAIITYNENYNKSGIRFSNDGNVYFRIYVESDNFQHLNDLFTLKYATKDKSANKYFIDLGKIDSSKLIKNIKTLIKRFNFKSSLSKKSIRITSFINIQDFDEIGETVEKTNYENTLKLNMKVIEFENNILKKNFPFSTVKMLKEFIFYENDNHDYIFNSNFKNKSKLTDNEIFQVLNISLSKFDNSFEYEDICDIITNDIRNFKDDSEVKVTPDVDDSLSELDQMNIVLQAIIEDKTYSEAAELAGISEDKIYDWYEEGENSINENSIYFFDKLNEILFKPEDENDEKNEIGEDNISEHPIEEETDDTDNEENIPEETDDFDNEKNVSEEIEDEPIEKKVYRFPSYLFRPGIDVYQEVIETFPYEIPRQDQLEIISEVAYAINKGYKYIFLEAGTGAGKSAIAATLARIYENSYILTVTKQLQNQYFEDFKKYGFKLVKGRQNFNCIHHKDLSCDKGDCVLKNKVCDYNLTGSNPLEKLESACQDYFWKSNTHCPYWIQKVDALNSKVTIANYDFGLYDFNLSHYFKKRKLLILDEAHNLENKIMSFISLDLNRNTLKRDIGLDLDFNTIDMLQKGNARDWISFVKQVKEKYDDRAKILINQAKADGEDDEGFIKDLEKELKIQSANRERFINYISNDKNNWICDYDSRNEIISFKPLSVKNYTHDYLFSYGDVCIFMSATILNHKKFAQWMGINFNEVYSIKKDSPFNSADNPIIIKDSFNMSRGYLKDSAPKTIPVLNEILAKHKNEKGLIHTVSKDCRRYIMKHIDDDRLMTHTTKNRNRKLEEYKSSKNSVLVSPSMSEGVDLPGEQCRFQVIYKLPFMTLSEQVRQRLNEDEEWYDYRTCISLVQTFGRGIRFDGDYCTTYVVDSRFKDFIRKDKKENQFIPDYVLDAIK
jgi:Rad3-related DNA helicase